MEEFMDSLMGLFQAITNHLETQDKAIEKLFENQKELKAKDNEIEHQLGIIFENQIGHQDICGNS